MAANVFYRTELARQQGLLSKQRQLILEQRKLEIRRLETQQKELQQQQLELHKEINILEQIHALDIALVPIQMPKLNESGGRYRHTNKKHLSRRKTHRRRN